MYLVGGHENAERYTPKKVNLVLSMTRLRILLLKLNLTCFTTTTTFEMTAPHPLSANSKQNSYLGVLKVIVLTACEILLYLQPYIEY